MSDEVQTWDFTFTETHTIRLSGTDKEVALAEARELWEAGSGDWRSHRCSGVDIAVAADAEAS